MPESESKSERFKRIATKRAQNAIKKIELLGSLSSKAYEYTSEEVEKMFSALQETLDKTKARFSASNPGTKKFEL